MQHWKTNRFVPLIALLFLLAACSGRSQQSATDQGTEGSAATAQADQGSAAAPAPALTTRSQEAVKPVVPMVLPKGTTMRVRLDQQVGSKISQAGQSFTASLAEPVTSKGQTVIPAGAHVSGTVTNAKALGRFSGEATLSLKLNSVTVGGREYPIETATYSQVKKGKGKRTAVGVGGGAGLGALVGGLVGGGKAAAIGAAAGAGVGAAGSAVTGNDDIVLPAETAVSFRLTQPVQIR